MAQLSLRALARDYAEGRMSQEDYRKARAELIESVLDADNTDQPLTQASYTLPAGGETATAETASSKSSPTFSNVDLDKPAEDLGFNIEPTSNLAIQQPLILAAIAGAAILFGAIALLGGADDETPETATAVTAADSSTADATQSDGDTIQDTDAGDSDAEAMTAEDQQRLADASNPAVALMREFLDIPSWQAQTMDDFVSKWRALSVEDRETALESPASRRLADRIYQLLLEERALSALDGGVPTTAETRLLEFAEQINLQDKRLSQSDQ